MTTRTAVTHALALLAGLLVVPRCRLIVRLGLLLTVFAWFICLQPMNNHRTSGPGTGFITILTRAASRGNALVHPSLIRPLSSVEAKQAYEHVINNPVLV